MDQRRKAGMRADLMPVMAQLAPVFQLKAMI
jgi:hypothetical protein